MVVKKILQLSILLIGGSYFSAQAINLQFMDNSPVRFFSEKDWEMATAASDQALADPADGNKVSWENPDTGNSGSSTAAQTQERDGKTCRELSIENQARGLTNDSAFLFCKQPDGEWKMELPLAKKSAP